MSIQQIMHDFTKWPIIQSTIWLFVCLGVFSVLQEIFPFDKKQPKIRKDVGVDIFYWIIPGLFYALISGSFVTIGYFIIFGGNTDKIMEYATHGAAWTKSMPIWLQAILVLIITDISLYWTHRLFHQDALWKYHAIHHGAQNLDWLHSVRFHPVNIVFHTIFANALVLWLGFSPLAIAALIPFNIFYSCMVHANLNWTFGKLGVIFASPVFHRWHHTSPDEGGNLNFAATFSILDKIFGTYYMPEGKKPGPTGIFEEYVPKTVIGQMTYPFVPKNEDGTVKPHNNGEIAAE